MTGLKNWDEGRLMGGEVVTGRGPALSFGRGLAVESLYVVRGRWGRPWSGSGSGRRREERWCIGGWIFTELGSDLRVEGWGDMGR